jgi:hypothetical protein
MALKDKLKEADSKNICRNCASVNVATARSGFLAHFFLKRVYGLDVASLGGEIKARLLGRSFKKQSLSIIFNIIKRLPLLNKFLNIKPLTPTNIRICSNCGFIGPDEAYSYELLNGIYHDYRSENYNKDRCMYEPEYKKIQHLVGKDSREVKERLANIDEILNKYVDINKIKNILDWGGGEGRFIPACLSKKNIVILDVSNEPLLNKRYSRVSTPPDSIKFDFIQVCHVLEHVSAPMEFLENVMRHSSYGGLIYVEVPQDRSDADIVDFQRHSDQMRHVIHEHLNLYTENAVLALGTALGLEVVCVKKTWINLGSHKSCVISGLFINKVKDSELDFE